MNQQEILDYIKQPMNAHNLSKMHNSKIRDILFGKEYVYMLTFTLDPKKNKFSEDLYNDVEQYILKLIRRISFKKCIWVREGSDDDHKHTHWHIGIITNDFLRKSDYSKTYVKKYGNIDHSKSKTKDFKHIEDYLSKQSPPSNLDP